MFIGIDENDQTVDIDEATRGGKYFCPECSTRLIVKDGEINVKHFAHESLTDCDSWGEMSAWHKDWQSKFNKEAREVVLQKGGKKHRADVHVSVKGINLTIEFQKSPITKSEIMKRTNFYTQFGKVLWVFDLRSKDVKINKGYDKLYRFRWNYANKHIPSPKEFVNENVSFCFHLPNDRMVFPCGIEFDKYRTFYSRKSDYIHKNIFLDVIKNNYFLKPYSRHTFIQSYKTPIEYKKSLNRSKYTEKDLRKLERINPVYKEMVELGFIMLEELYSDNSKRNDAYLKYDEYMKQY